MSCDVYTCNAEGTPYRFLSHGSRIEKRVAYCDHHATEFKRIFGPYGMIRKAPSDGRVYHSRTTADQT